MAAGGAGYANHAEFNVVPASLVVPVPDDVPLEAAAFATLGAVSMHGFRQGAMQLGEVAVVIGLGLVGQLLLQFLRAAGIAAVGIDLDTERANWRFSPAVRKRPAIRMTAACVKRWSVLPAAGADCVFLTAGGTSNER